MKKIIIVIYLLTGSILVNAQRNYTTRSKDKTVSATTFINHGEGLDSVIVTNKKHKMRFLPSTPLFNFYDKNNEPEPEPIGNYFTAYSIQKIKKNIYLLVGLGGYRNFEIELHLIIIKKNKILKYYIVKSGDKTLRDPRFKYLSKTKEILISIPKLDTPENSVHEINLKENKFKIIKSLTAKELTVKPLTEKTLTKKVSDSLFYHYKLKIK